MNANKDVVEVHGCIVCGKVYNVLAVYTQDGRLLNSTVTSPGGHIVANEQQPLVACDSHSSMAIDSALKRWKSRNEGQNNEKED